MGRASSKMDSALVLAKASCRGSDESQRFVLEQEFFLGYRNKEFPDPNVFLQRLMDSGELAKATLVAAGMSKYFTIAKALDGISKKQ